MEHETRFEFIESAAFDTVSLPANWRPRRRLRLLLRITRLSLAIRPHVGNVLLLLNSLMYTRLRVQEGT